MISLIVAMDKNRAIGKKSRLPWHLPADLARFKQITFGHSIIMGRKTFDSIGRALPGRTNIVITRNSDWFTQSAVEGAGVLRASSLEEAINLAEQAEGSGEIFIIGGGEIFKEAILLTDRLYVTEVLTKVAGADTFFPGIPKEAWVKITREHHEHDEKNEFEYDFVIYERR